MATRTNGTMGRRTKKKKKPSRARSRAGGGDGRVSPSFFSVSLPVTQKRWLSFRTMSTINNAGNTGANTTFQLFAPQALSPSVPGLQAYFGTSLTTSALYGAARLLAVRARATVSNIDTFPSRFALALTASAPANNTLQTQATQAPLMSATATQVKDVMLGPLTGNGRATLFLSGSNNRNLGVRNVRGLSDAYTNVFDSATDSVVAATSGFSVVVLVLGSSNLVSGVSVDLEAELFMEFFSPNALKTV